MASKKRKQDPARSSHFLFQTLGSRYPWLPTVSIIIAAICAHGLCLFSIFYLDDHHVIEHSSLIQAGGWYQAKTRFLPYLTFYLTYKLAGISPPLFHLGNLFIHILTALMVHRTALFVLKNYNNDRQTIAWWSGLIFAVHPLATEVTNYTQTRFIEMVTFFIVLAAWATLMATERKKPAWLLLAGLASVGAMFSKEIGTPLVIGSLLLIFWHQYPVKRKGIYFLLLGISACLILGIVFFLGFWDTIATKLSNFRLPWHILTQCRVFWRYAWLIIFPFSLCSDHYIPWTYSLKDPYAWLSVLAILATVITMVRLAFKGKRTIAMLIGLAILPFVLRLPIPSSELMVEYRLYPSMVWIAILCAILLNRFANGVTIRQLLVLVYVLILIVTSGVRCTTWWSYPKIVEDVITKYPNQLRARVGLQERYLCSGNYYGVIALKNQIEDSFMSVNSYNQHHPYRKYDPEHLNLWRLSSESLYAQTLARQGKIGKALQHLAWIKSRMEINRLNHPIYKGTYYHALGMVELRAGKTADALADLKKGMQFSGSFEHRQDYLKAINLINKSNK